MITANAPLIGPPSGYLVDALAWSQGRADEYVKEAWRLGQLLHLDCAILVSQSAHETNDWSSYYWNTRFNPAGIGITGDPTQNEASQTWATQTDAARGHIVHLLAYLKSPAEVAGDVLAALGTEPATYDARWLAPSRAGYRARTVRDLAGRWAVDLDYAGKIVAKHRRMFGESPMSESLHFGRVPYPTVERSPLSASNPMIVTSGAPDVPEAVVWHRMLGTWRGTDGWFHAGHAATAYGVAVRATDGADAGRIFEWVAPGTGWYGESSGPATAPYGDGLALVERFGVPSVNRVTKAIEISGNYDTPLDAASRASIVVLTAYWADQRRIPWDQFPIVPGQERSFVVWHQEICGPAEKVCPGAVVMAETSALIAAVARVLKAAQTTGSASAPPVYAAPELPEWWAAAVGMSWPRDAKDGELTYRVCRRRAEALKVAVRRARPDTSAPRSGPNIAVREKVHVERVVRVGAKDWLVTNDGHYLAASSFTPEIRIRPR